MVGYLKNNIFKAQNIPHKSTKIMSQNNTSQFHKITIHQNVSQYVYWHACSKPPKIDHAKYVLAMCSHFFSLLSFCYHAYWSVNPWGTYFTWSHPPRVAFQFNQEPSWLPRYRHLAFSRFISICQITHESKTSSGLKDSDIVHKILEQATPFFPLFHQFGTPIWKFWPPRAFNKSMGQWIPL